MGNRLEALLRLQAIERQLAEVRQRLRIRKSGVVSQQRRLEQLQAEFEALHEKAMSRRRNGDMLDLGLKEKEEHVSRLRTALNSTKTNKEYAAILTQINTLKADSAKVEEEALKVMQEADEIAAEAQAVQEKIAQARKHLEEIEHISQEEITRLNGMMEELNAKRREAAKDVSPDDLAMFNRIAETYDGQAMAAIEIHGKKPPYDYICGGCFMALNAEHANALRTRDEIRTCDNCGRILYLASETEESRTA